MEELASQRLWLWTLDKNVVFTINVYMVCSYSASLSATTIQSYVLKKCNKFITFGNNLSFVLSFL